MINLFMVHFIDHVFQMLHGNETGGPMTVQNNLLSHTNDEALELRLVTGQSGGQCHSANETEQMIGSEYRYHPIVYLNLSGDADFLERVSQAANSQQIASKLISSLK